MGSSILLSPTQNNPPSNPQSTPPLQQKPNLQGVWLSNSATPLERPKALEGRQFLTDAEITELKKRADRLFKSGNSDYAAGDNAFLAAEKGGLLDGNLYLRSGDPGYSQPDGRQSGWGTVGDPKIHPICIDQTRPPQLVHNFSLSATCRHLDR